MECVVEGVSIGDGIGTSSDGDECGEGGEGIGVDEASERGRVIVAVVGIDLEGEGDLIAGCYYGCYSDVEPAVIEADTWRRSIDAVVVRIDLAGSASIPSNRVSVITLLDALSIPIAADTQLADACIVDKGVEIT